MSSSGAIHARELHYVRAGRTILDGATMSAAPGESLAVMGPSGSGKSSLLALLADLERPDRGEIVHDQPAGRLGLVLQGYGLVSLLTAAENVEVALQAGAKGGAGSKRLTPEQIQQRAAVVIAAVGLVEVADHLTEQLSGGQQQRVAIARALVVEPDVILADELTAELDHEWKHRVLDLVFDIARRGGIVVLATHDPEVAARCDRVLRLESGHLHPDDT
ncbi:MAG: ATP-binding cassette domain-containing protein [Nocardioidaceae bacterium]